MSRIIGNLDIRYIGKNDEELYMLLDNFTYESDVAGITISVTKGFVTDLSSVPRAPLAYWLTGGKAKIASVFHDFLCVHKITSREVADKVFLEIMELTGVPSWRRTAMFAGVRAYAVFTGKDTNGLDLSTSKIDEDIYKG